MNYANLKANDDVNDVFFTAVKNLEVKGSMSQSATLYRPMAQINIGTDDIDKAALAQVSLTDTDISVSGVYDTLNLLSGIASAKESERVTAEFNTVRPVNSDTDNKIKYPQGEEYEYLAMVYVLTGSVIENDDVNKAQSELSTLTLTLNNNGEKLNTIEIPSMPIQRNYRTNVYGSLLTSTTDWHISVAPDFYKDDFNQEYVTPWDGVTAEVPEINEEGTAEIETAAEFVGLARALTSGEVKVGNQPGELQEIVLDKDLDFNGNTFLGFGREGKAGVEEWNNYQTLRMQVNFDGQGHTISNVVIPSHRYGTGLFNNLAGGSVVKNVVIENMTLGNEARGNIIGFIAGYCYGGTFENITVRNSKLLAFGKCGAIVGVCDEDKTTSKFINCKVENVEIEGGQILGGMIGYVHEYHNVEFVNCPEPDVKFTVNKDPEDEYINYTGSFGWIPDGYNATITKLNFPDVENALFYLYPMVHQGVQYYFIYSTTAKYYVYYYKDKEHGDVTASFDYNGEQVWAYVADYPVNEPVNTTAFHTDINPTPADTPSSSPVHRVKPRM